MSQSVRFKSIPEPHACGWRVGLRHFRAFALSTLFLLLFGYSAFKLGSDWLAGDLHRIISGQLNQRLAASGWRVEVGSAQWESGIGLRLGDVQILSPRASSPLLTLSAVVVRMSNLPQQLAGAAVAIEGIDIIDANMTIELAELDQVDFDELQRWIDAKRAAGPLTFPIEISHSTLVLRDRARRHLQNERVIESLCLSVRPRQEFSGRAVSIAGSLQFDECPQLQFAGLHQPENGAWQLVGRAPRLTIDTCWLELLPYRWGQALEHLDLLRGQAAIEFSAGGNLNDNVLSRFDLRGDLENLAVHDSRWAQPLLNGSGRICADLQKLTLSDFCGRLGSADASLQHAEWRWDQANTWQLEGAIRNLEIDPRWNSILPAAAVQLISDIEPQGTMDLHFALQRNGSGLQRNIRAEFHDLAFTFCKFPYRLEHGVGTAQWTGNRAEFSVQTLEQGQIVTVAGWIDDPGPQATFQIDFGNEVALAIDQKVLTAIDRYPKVSEQIRAFDPTGRYCVRGRFYRVRSDVRPQLDYDIELVNCTVRHAGFPYRVRELQGNVLVRGNRFTLHQVAGRHFGSRITCDGGWSDSDGLSMRIIGDQVALDHELYDATPPAVREVWQALRPQGTIDLVRVDLRQPSDSRALDIRVGLNLNAESGDPISAVAIQPVAFPYRLERVSGNIEVADGKVQLNDLQASHEKTWISAAGRGSYDASHWQVDFERLLVGALQCDEALLSAVPDSLSCGLAALDYRGLINLNGRLVLAQSLAPDPAGPVALVAYQQPAAASRPAMWQPMTMQWDVRLELNQGQMNVGVPVEGVFGSVQLQGVYDGRAAICEGSLDLDSLSIYDMQCVNLKGPLWIDEQRVGVGRFAHADDSQAGESLSGQLFGGKVSLDGKLWRGDEGSTYFYLQTAGQQLNVREAAISLSSTQGDVGGKASGRLRLSGKTDDARSVVGDGGLEIRDAQLYELPVFFALLKLLVRPDKSSAAFDMCRAEFAIQHQQINLQRIEVIGDAVSLLGNGQMNLNRQIDLNFFTVAGRNRFYIPILSELYELGSQQILWITVNGTVDQPETQQIILPGVNDAMRQLLDVPNP